MKATIALLGGDGIGPEILAATVPCLDAVAARFGHEFRFVEAAIGGAALRQGLPALPCATLELAMASDAVLFGAVGDPAWDREHGQGAIEHALLELRRALGVFANLRPYRPHPSTALASPLRAEILRDVDVLFVRELLGGIYFGDKTLTARDATDVARYSVAEIERVTRVAARLATERRGKLTSIDKANVLATSRLWRSTVSRVVDEEFPTVTLEHLYVDAAAMQLLRTPRAFDVVLGDNLFGDILTDELALLTGSIGVCPSASIGSTGPGLFEPIHGSAPDLVGSGRANPIGAIASAALLLRWGLGLRHEANVVEQAIAEVLGDGIVTPDLAASGSRAATTAEVGDLVTARVRGFR